MHWWKIVFEFLRFEEEERKKKSAPKRERSEKAALEAKMMWYACVVIVDVYEWTVHFIRCHTAQPSITRYRNNEYSRTSRSEKKTLKEKWIGALFWNMRNCCLEFEAAAMPRVQLNKMEWNNIKYDPANRVAKKPFKIARIRAPRQRERKKRRVVFGRTSQIHHHCRSLRILYYWRNTRNRMLIGVWRLRAHHHLEGPLEIDEINLILFFFGLVLRPFWRTPRENDFGRCQKWAARCVRQPGCDLRHADNPCESHRKALGAQNKKLCSLDADNSNCKKNNNNRAAARKIK